MKRILLLLVFIPSFLFSQTPQGVGYQGVATDLNGVELINQTISIQASVLSSSTAGNIEWQEEHSVTTDAFGLFNLIIGQGTSTGNGAQANFVDITWGSNTHFLKIEMDVNGGTNYSHMGTNQMMSVPYALYAENANFDYDSIVTILSNDSSFTNVLGTNCMSLGSLINIQNTSPNLDTLINQDGFLLVTINASNQNCKGIRIKDSNFQTIIDYFVCSYKELTIPVKKGQYLNYDQYVGFKGFIPLECGSSSSTVDSSYIDSLVQFYYSGNGGDCNPQFPDGFEMLTAVTSTYSSSNPYTVPINKRLYISSSTASLIINGIDISLPEGKHILCNSGDVLTYPNQQNFSGFLVNNNSSISALTSTYSVSNPYTVPTNKRLYISSSTASLIINGINISVTAGKHILCNSGDVLTYPNQQNFSGYLVDENHFSNCGGGASSSSSTSSLDSTAIANMIAAAAGGYSNLKFPDGVDGDFLTVELCDVNQNTSPYTVPSGKTLYITSVLSGEISMTNDNGGTSQYLIGESNQGSSEGKSLNNPLILKSGQTISGYNNQSNSTAINGFLVENSDVNPITWEGVTYTVPSGKKLYITNTFNGNILIDNIRISNPSNYFFLGQPILVDENQVVNPTGSGTFNGYLVDDDYFSNSGGSSPVSGNMIVSTFGDTLTLNGQSIIVPGVSYSNIVPLFDSITDIDGNTYQTVVYGNNEWMIENLTTTTFSDGTPINQICFCGTNTNNMCQSPGWCNYNSDSSFNAQFGKLYNGYTISSGKNVCPVGWHVSSSVDWDKITDLFVTSGSLWSNSGTNGLGTSSGNATSLILSQTNESYLSLQLGGFNGSNGSGNFMGSFDSYWLSEFFTNTGNNHHAEIFIDSNLGYHVVYLGSASQWDYKYIRCVKD